MIGGQWWLVWGILATLGAPLVAVGLVLRACESGWQKPAGSLGSHGLLVIGSFLCVPLLLYLVPALLERLPG
jgi:hypothetical protein